LSEEFHRGTGRRKESVARVRLYAGTGEVTVNGRTLEDFFPNKRQRIEALAALVHLELKGNFDVIAKLEGGGMTGRPVRYASESPGLWSSLMRPSGESLKKAVS